MNSESAWWKSLYSYISNSHILHIRNRFKTCFLKKTKFVGQSNSAKSIWIVWKTVAIFCMANVDAQISIDNCESTNWYFFHVLHSWWVKFKILQRMNISGKIFSQCQLMCLTEIPAQLFTRVYILLTSEKYIIFCISASKYVCY